MTTSCLPVASIASVKALPRVGEVPPAIATLTMVASVQRFEPGVFAVVTELKLEMQGP